MKHFQRHLKGLTLIGIFGISSCQSPKLIFQNKPGHKPKEISLLPIGNTEVAGENLGSTPLEIDVDQLKNKMLRIEPEKGGAQFWMFPHLSASKNTITLAFPESQTENSKNGTSAPDDYVSANTRNQINRLMLKAYQAITGGKFSTAVELAKQASSIDSKVAAPHIVQGLALMREGKKNEALAAFEKAKALDPADADINLLIESVR